MNLETEKFNPMILKKRLGEELVSKYHNKFEAEKARVEFEKQFSKREVRTRFRSC